MKKYIGLIIGGVALIGIIAGASILYLGLTKEYDSGQNLVVKEEAEESAGSAQEQEKVMAPDFTMEDADGQETSLYHFLGKPVVLNFWASWCGPCKTELPDFQAAYEAYKGEVEFVMVNMTDGARETKEIASAFIAEQGYTLPFYFDTAQSAAYTYGVYSLPTTYFIGADGEIVAGAQGMMDAETLALGISMIATAENN